MPPTGGQALAHHPTMRLVPPVLPSLREEVPNVRPASDNVGSPVLAPGSEPALRPPAGRQCRSSNGVQVSLRQPVTRRDWPQALAELAAQLDDGRIYDRDLAGLSLALDAVLDAYHRRHHVGLRAEGHRSIGGPRDRPR